jgi:hypothetical protein
MQEIENRPSTNQIEKPKTRNCTSRLLTILNNYIRRPTPNKDYPNHSERTPNNTTVYFGNQEIQAQQEIPPSPPKLTETTETKEANISISTETPITSLPLQQLSSSSCIEETTVYPNIQKEKSIDIWRKKLQAHEKGKWEKILGTDIEVTIPNTSITPQLRNSLNKLGLRLVYIPNLNLNTLQELQTIGTAKFLKSIKDRYPNWMPYESIQDKDSLESSYEDDKDIDQTSSDQQPEKPNNNTTINLKESFWKSVLEKEVAFPKLPGQWMAIEYRPKPKIKEPYEPNLIDNYLGNRFTSWDKANLAISNNKDYILERLKLNSENEIYIRMPEIIEFNLLANRFEWGETSTYEWTNTERTSYKEDKKISSRLITGNSGTGGAASYFWHYPTLKVKNAIGYRIAITFPITQAQPITP